PRHAHRHGLRAPAGAAAPPGAHALPGAPSGGRRNTAPQAPRAPPPPAPCRAGGRPLAWARSLSVEPLRGNVDTRLRKRLERGLDAVVLAACGLDRLGLDAEIGARLDPEVMLPEAGQ